MNTYSLLFLWKIPPICSVVGCYLETVSVKMSSSSCNILESLDCTEFLVFGSTNAIQSCETVISGSLDALIVYATKLRDSGIT